MLAPAFYTDPEWSTRYLRRSAERHAVPIRWYGAGEPYGGWFNVQLTRLLLELEALTSPLVVYVDGSDSVVMGTTTLLVDRYRVFGSPRLLMSVERDGLNAGGWLGDRMYAIDCLYTLKNMECESENPQIRWREAARRGLVSVTVDRKSLMFRVVESDADWLGRATRPFAAHWAGGYTDPVVGKAALIEPTWRELGYAATVSEEGERLP